MIKRLTLLQRAAGVGSDDFGSRWRRQELYESSLDTARRRGAWFASDEARPLLADEERFLVPDTRQLLITDQYLITTVGASL